MSEDEKKNKPTYLMVPRRLIRTWLVSNVVMLLLIGTSFQYTNYVFRQLCGVITISDDSYKAAPSPYATGKLLAKEMDRIRTKYHCK